MLGNGKLNKHERGVANNILAFEEMAYDVKFQNLNSKVL